MLKQKPGRFLTPGFWIVANFRGVLEVEPQRELQVALRVRLGIGDLTEVIATECHSRFSPLRSIGHVKCLRAELHIVTLREAETLE